MSVIWITLAAVAGLIVCAISTILGLAVIRARRRAKADDRRTLAEVPGYLQTLLRRGYDRAFIIITDIPTDRFVQFAKYVRPQREIGLQLGFPRVEWSEEFYEAVQAFLEAHDIPFSIQPTGAPPVTEMLHVDCGRDVDRATFLVERIFRDIFAIPADRSFRVRGEGMSFKDELIDITPPERP
jgi:hypothetical protein